MRLFKNAASSPRIFGMLVVAFALGIALGLSASGILANHSGDGMIHACVHHVSGAMRYVQTPDQCTRYEQLVEWQSTADPAQVEDRLTALEIQIGDLTMQLNLLNDQVPDCLSTEEGDAVFDCDVTVNGDIHLNGAIIGPPF